MGEKGKRKKKKNNVWFFLYKNMSFGARDTIHNIHGWIDTDE